MRFLLGLLFSIQVSAATVVTETVGQAADHVVTSREVQISMVIENILYPPKTPLKGLYEVRPGQAEFRNAVTSVLLESVLALEAENFNVASISESEISAAISKVEKAVAGKTYWSQLEVSSVLLKKLVTRKLTAKSFLAFKTSSMSGIITDQEAQAYYEKNRVKFGSHPFSSFKDNIKSFLAQQQLEERIRSWFEVIKRKYKVRTFHSE
ncbi:MAG: hypothetical protein OM95_12255 [Bdellovibrio sp. ArHS]|uniref:hypothetical protein n=1 Tax=Bdellovibrio sp. ArHS TaxID=1569284 RepID=UPI0005835037|nr:hypothetical protein [Bdellovibrio sp. ArHS]KHD87781.1 MAG: hypothetical protein OM95_12255 [Bdellovibrio sp. ArHS]